MGLSTVRGIVATHGGVVDVQTTVGMGTTMRVFLPAAVDLASPDGARAQTPRGHGELILIVDDEPGIRSMIEHALGRSGYRTLCATDGAEAMAVFTTHAQAIALVVTDVDMPRLSGAALALALRELRPDLPLLVMSGLASGGDRADEVFAARALAQQFLLKPFSPEVLLSAIHRLLHP
jgi:CheY-like chemotaxis protein